MGVVYLMYDEGNGLCKIGVTRGSAENRLRTLQTGNSNKISIVHVYQTDDPFKIESLLHNRFRMQHESGEWFALTYEDMADFPQTCKWAQGIVDALRDNPFYNRG